MMLPSNLKNNFFFMYKINSYESFTKVSSWLTDAKNAAKKNCSICLIGNKCDLKDNRTVSLNEASKFSQENSIYIFFILDLLHYECSALSGDNIEESFSALCRNILQKIDDGIIQMDDDPLKKFIKPIGELDQENDEQRYQCWKC